MFCKAANFHCSVISMHTHTSRTNPKYKQAATRLPFTNFKCFVYLLYVAIEFIRLRLLVYLTKSISVYFLLCVRLRGSSVSTVRFDGGTHTADERLYALLCFALVLTLSPPNSIKPILSTICLCECEYECDRVRRCLCSKRCIPVSK